MTSNLRIHGIINANHAFTALIEEGGRGGRSPKRLKDNSRNFQKENIFLLDLHNTICNPTTSMKWEKQLVKGFWMKESFF